MGTISWNAGKWYDGDCDVKKGFICSHKKWNSPQKALTCSDKSPSKCTQLQNESERREICTNSEVLRNCAASCGLCPLVRHPGSGLSSANCPDGCRSVRDDCMCFSESTTKLSPWKIAKWANISEICNTAGPLMAPLTFSDQLTNFKFRFE